MTLALTVQTGAPALTIVVLASRESCRTLSKHLELQDLSGIMQGPIDVLAAPHVVQ
jgi:hypothetical protein